MGPRAARIGAVPTIALVLIAKDKHWRLSPAYDLTPAPVIAKERRDMAMACGDMGRFANAKNILSQHARFLLKEEEAVKIVNDMVKSGPRHLVQYRPRLWCFRKRRGSYSRRLPV